MKIYKNRVIIIDIIAIIDKPNLFFIEQFTDLKFGFSSAEPKQKILNDKS